MALSDAVKVKLDAGKSLRVIAAELNADGVPTARGGQWHLTSVKRLVDRLATENLNCPRNTAI